MVTEYFILQIKKNLLENFLKIWQQDTVLSIKIMANVLMDNGKKMF